MNRLIFKFKPTQIIVMGFAFFILIGASLLSLPIASNNGDSVGIINALFTATSAVCVTGLAVVNTMEHWTMFGKVVILFLIQIGGLGFMTITTMLFLLLGKKIRFKERLVIQEALNHYSLSGMVRITKNILIGTMLMEIVGAIILSIKFVPVYGSYGIFMGLFHSISAFCNAGFDIIGEASLTPYVHDTVINFTIMILIVIGGIGFSVWIDFIKVYKEVKEKRRTGKSIFQKLSLHSKLVLVLTFGLIGIGFVFILLFEWNNPETMGTFSIKNKLLSALFHSITPRTAGFSTLAVSEMGDATKLFTMILMYIGGSPGGTAGGIKTVTMGVLFVSVLSTIRAKEDVEIFQRRIPEKIVQRSLAVIMISIALVMGSTMLLSITENSSFMEVFFEAVSAFATVGLSLGITENLTDFGKIFIIITMFVGRLGPVTMAVAFSLKGSQKKCSIKKPEEKVMVG